VHPGRWKPRCRLLLTLALQRAPAQPADAERARAESQRRLASRLGTSPAETVIDGGSGLSRQLMQPDGSGSMPGLISVLQDAPARRANPSRTPR
jgi:hypothetical protein